MADFNDKPSGGALKPSATMGESQYFLMARKYPKTAFLDRLTRDTIEDVDDELAREELQRAYLVDIRIVEKTWADSHESYPLLKLYYATPDAQRIYRVKTTSFVDSTSTGGYKLTNEAREELRRSILTAGDGRPDPVPADDFGVEEIRDQYRRVLRDEHGLTSPASHTSVDAEECGA